MTATTPIDDAGVSNPETHHSDDLQIFLDIVQLVNNHHSEDELIQAVLLRLDQMKASAGIVLRRLDTLTNTLRPCPIRDTASNPGGLMANAGPALRDVLNSVIIDVDGSFEGHAFTNNVCFKVNEGQAPDIELSDTYIKTLETVLSLDCAEALFLPVHAAQPVGTLVLYSIGDVKVDDRRAQLLERSAQVLAFGIEKCRALAQVDEQSEALQASSERLTASNRDLQDFAYVASHDLQEPLRKIQAFGDRLESKAGDRLSPESVKNLQRMQSSSHQMQELINELLRYSRVASATLQKSRVDLGRLVEMSLANHGAALAETGGAITVSEHLPTVEVDSAQFDQVFDTLIGNAVKYRRPEKPLVIEVGYDDDDPDFYRITVRDNGVGFEQKYAERVFEPFKRLHSSADYAGSGIGLAICRSVIDRHGGEISVESSPGNGSMFIISLPKPK